MSLDTTVVEVAVSLPLSETAHVAMIASVTSSWHHEFIALIYYGEFKFIESMFIIAKPRM